MCPVNYIQIKKAPHSDTKLHPYSSYPAPPAERGGGLESIPVSSETEEEGGSSPGGTQRDDHSIHCSSAESIQKPEETERKQKKKNNIINKCLQNFCRFKSGQIEDFLRPF